jgi:CRISPR-associated protein Cmr1
MKMIQREYTLRFVTPAFLGNAEQSGQWRIPPFKAQLRQWWRVAYAASKNFPVGLAPMREAEGQLFGNAWLAGNFSKSRVRMRLGQWSAGKLKSWDGLEQGRVDHPEVGSSRKVGPHAYLAYGPLDGRGGTMFSDKMNAAIQAGEFTNFSLAYPDDHAPLIEQALWLMNRFGTVGGRGRNGWGSYALQGSALTGVAPLRDWKQCLQLDWPHALGQDGKGPLLWETQPQKDWKALMKELAVLKIGLRTRFKFPSAQPDGQIHDRHWLSYPVTRHPVRAWGNTARLPNSLRFKVRPTADGQLVGAIFHMPCLPPRAFGPNPAAIERVWQDVHAFLDDGHVRLTRIKV